MRFPRTELECSVKGYTSAIFQHCSLPIEGNIKFQLFTQRVAQMFAGPDPFSGVDALVPLPTGGKGLEEIPATQSSAPTSVFPNYIWPALQVADSSKSTSNRDNPRPSKHVNPGPSRHNNPGSSKCIDTGPSKCIDAGPSKHVDAGSSRRNDAGPSLISSTHPHKTPSPGDGWYVAYNAVIPGVYCGP